MDKEEWNKGITAWEKIRGQAVLDIEQADLYISAIKAKIEQIETEEKNGK